MYRMIILLCAVFPVFCSCSNEREIADASKVIDAYYSSIRAGKAEDVMPLFSEDFAVKNPRESWVETMNGINAQMGPLVQWKRSSDNVHYYPHTYGNQDTVVMTFHVQYAKHQSRELFTLVKDPTSGQYRICGVDITGKNMK